jgi:hypothetical protein
MIVAGNAVRSASVDSDLETGAILLSAALGEAGYSKGLGWSPAGVICAELGTAKIATAVRCT